MNDGVILVLPYLVFRLTMLAAVFLGLFLAIRRGLIRDDDPVRFLALTTRPLLDNRRETLRREKR